MEQPLFTLSQRQHWMAVLAASHPASLATRLAALHAVPPFEVIRPAETGLLQIQGRMGGSGDRFFAGDTTVTRAVIKLASGTYGYSYVLGRNTAHAERCALADALLQEPRHHLAVMETLIAPLQAEREAQIAARQAEINTSRVDFFTLVRGDNA
ncbi:phosphonate C-P lyase system protein PhnG [Shimwellia pseudoproteus]|uniref:phosphonate C-P lyase system protein PhnG n=1 Tax=Shimwellia pseudoproteus TaxID=570012 RepID=UPI0018EB2DE9|nr:phosphonate C-P lyase system protein PhnG [Shimwellia pseudoproteus]MBJ3815768.1 phosphonate C-P lyase system protein PhnG [Shimwellia pseudoproteus]